MTNFKDLRVYRAALDLAVAVYRATATFPANERYGITQQVRRAAASVGANLAEGSGRATAKDRIRFFDIARGSAHEVEHFLILCKRLDYLGQSSYGELVAQTISIQRMISRLKKSLRAGPDEP